MMWVATCRALILILAVGFSTPLLAQSYSIVDLGTLGGSTSQVSAINAYGQVVGYSAIAGDVATHAFLYGNTGMLDLGTLGGRDSFAQGINRSGRVVGVSDASGRERAFTYSGGLMNDLGSLAPGSWTKAFDINDLGQIVGYSAVTPEGNTSNRAFLSSAGSMTDLGTLGGSVSYAYGLNNSGQVVGWSNTSTSSAERAFLYANGAMTNLGAMGGVSSVALDINESGYIVGHTRSATDVVRGFVRQPNGNVINLGTLGGTDSGANAINNSGTVVGQSKMPGDSFTHAYIYKNGVMTDLNSLANSSVSGWDLRSASDINDSGQIVGTGTHNGQQRAYLLTPVPQLKQPLGPPPSRLAIPGLPSPTAGADGMVFITHGWGDNAAAGSWASAIASAETQALAQRGIAGEWDVVAYDWSSGAASGDPVVAADNATQIGGSLGKRLKQSQYQEFHLIAHSAGAWMINAMADELKTAGKTVRVTFLDAFVPWKYVGRDKLGASADYAEQYMDTRAAKYNTTIAPLLNPLWANGRIGVSLGQAFNADVTQLDPEYPNGLNPANVLEWHAWPHEFYRSSIGRGYGLDMSPELGSVPGHSTPEFERGKTVTFRGTAVPSPTAGSTPAYFRREGAIIDFGNTSYQFGDPTGSQMLGSRLFFSTHSPNWFAALVPVTDLVNTVEFDLQFKSVSDAEGLLSIYWDGTLIGNIDERFVLADLQHYTFDLPGTFAPNSYTLAFRLDPFTDVTSSVQIEAVSLSIAGPVELPEPSIIAPSLVLVGGSLAVRPRRGN